MKIERVDKDSEGYWYIIWDGAQTCVGRLHLYDIPPPKVGDEAIVKGVSPRQIKVWINGRLVRDGHVK